MKTLLTMIIILCSGLIFAQSSAIHKTELKKLSFFIGEWEGISTVYQRGQTLKVTQHEKIEFKLDSTIILVEGTGRDIDTRTILFQAIGLVFFDGAKKEYGFRSHINSGQFADSYFKLIGKEEIEWGFSIPQGKIRYHLVINSAKGTWIENGEFSPDGEIWYPTVMMELKKK